MKDTIHVLCATDNKYSSYCGVMLTSLLQNAEGDHYHIYIFADTSISKKNRAKFDILTENLGGTIDIVEIDNGLLANCPVNSYTNITLPTYYRLLAPQILPADVHKVIYLDCDIIINGNLRDLWEIDLSGKAIAGVVDCEAYNESIYKRLGNYTDKRDYFNAGVTVYNLDFWRQHSITQLSFQYINQNADKLYWMDQDVLNVILKDNKVLLPLEFNFETIYFLPKNWCNYDDALKFELLEKCKHPIIIHYNGPGKPWSFGYYGAPFNGDWDVVRKNSLWRGCRKILPLSKYFKYVLKRYLFRELLKKRIRSSWIVLPENKHCYHV